MVTKIISPDILKFQPHLETNNLVWKVISYMEKLFEINTLFCLKTTSDTAKRRATKNCEKLNSVTTKENDKEKLTWIQK